MIRKFAERLAKTAYVRAALTEEIDLRQFRIKPTVRMITGLFLIGLSYLIGWPAVAALGLLAIYLDEPLIVFIGGPATYVLSHFIFLVGAWLAGADHARILAKYATQRLFRKIQR
jgi:hypothetical protein